MKNSFIRIIAATSFAFMFGLMFHSSTYADVAKCKQGANGVSCPSGFLMMPDTNNCVLETTVQGWQSTCVAADPDKEVSCSQTAGLSPSATPPQLNCVFKTSNQGFCNSLNRTFNSGTNLCGVCKNNYAYLGTDPEDQQVHACTSLLCPTGQIPEDPNYDAATATEPPFCIDLAGVYDRVLINYEMILAILQLLGVDPAVIASIEEYVASLYDEHIDLGDITLQEILFGVEDDPGTPEDESALYPGIVGTITGAEASAGGGAREFVGITTTAFDGNQGGYTLMDATCAIEVDPDSHVCTSNDIIQAIQNSNPLLGSVSDITWVNAGVPANITPAVNDCNGWTSASNPYFGTVWNFASSAAAIQPCFQTKLVACCK